MSREIRRVPTGWNHPVEFNPNWRIQDPARKGRPRSRLHAVDEQFRPLFGMSFQEEVTAWEDDRKKWDAGQHEGLPFLLEYHSPEGWLNTDGTRDAPTPLTVYAEDGETVLHEFFPKTVQDILTRYPFWRYEGSKPTDEALYMPDFTAPLHELGWCLYETVSEGTPVTPVFATADELIDHLCTVGQDWDQEPMRRTSAETLVRRGYTFGSMLVANGAVLDSANDADVIDMIAKLPGGPNERLRQP